MTYMDSDTTKQHLSIITIGHRDDGRSALMQAIASLRARTDEEELISSTDTAQAHRIEISPASVDYETGNRQYSFVSDLSHAEYVRGMLTGTVAPDIAILIVSATDGLTEQIDEQIRIAQMSGVTILAAFIDNADTLDNDDHLHRLEREIRQLLSAYGFSGDDIPVISGPTRAAHGERSHEIWQDAIKQLMAAIDETISPPLSPADQPFLMAIEGVFEIAGRGATVTGRIERGVVRSGDVLDIVGLGRTQRVTCSGVEMFRKEIGQGVAGDHVGLLLNGISKDEIKPGQVVCTPGSMRAHARFEATAHILNAEEGGRDTPPSAGDTPQFHFDTAEIDGTIELAESETDDKTDIVVQLDRPVAIKPGQRFALRRGGRTVGVGVVSKTLDDALPPDELSSEDFHPDDPFSDEFLDALRPDLPEQGGVTENTTENTAKQVGPAILTAGFQEAPLPFEHDLQESKNQNADYTVWFGTDRAPLFEDERVVGYTYKRDGDLHLGRCKVFVPKGHLIGSTGSSWWKRIWRGDDRLKLLSIKPLDDHSFWQGLGDQLETDAQGRKIGIVFIHGYNTSFTDAAIRAAQVGFDIGIKSSMAMFSWPSMGAMPGYGYDAESITASESNLYNFLTSYVEKTGVEKLHIIAHSMGNRLLMRCVQRISWDTSSPLAAVMGQAILAAPDVYAETFRLHADGYVALCDRVTVYSSSRDLAVKLSRILHVVDRVGLYPPITLHPGIDTICATDMSVSLLGHTYFASARPLLTDIKSLIFQNSAPEHRMGLRKYEDTTGSYWKFLE